MAGRKEVSEGKEELLNNVSCLDECETLSFSPDGSGEKRSNKNRHDEHSDSPNKKAQEKTEREEYSSLENLGVKASLLLIIPKLNFP